MRDVSLDGQGAMEVEGGRKESQTPPPCVNPFRRGLPSQGSWRPPQIRMPHIWISIVVLSPQNTMTSTLLIAETIQAVTLQDLLIREYRAMRCVRVYPQRKEIDLSSAIRDGVSIHSVRVNVVSLLYSIQRLGRGGAKGNRW